jgi:hypothetical protein
MYSAVEKTFTTTNGHAIDPRIDHVYMKPAVTPGNEQTVKQIDPDTENISDVALDTNLAYDYDFAYIEGTADSSPVGPTAPVGYTESDKICEIRIEPGSASLPQGQITDTRGLFNIDPELVPGVTALEASAITLDPEVEGQGTAQLALEALETGLAAASATGLLAGHFEFVSHDTVQLTPGIGGSLRIEINGTVLEQASALTFTLPGLSSGGADLDQGVEAASVAYYCYVYNSASTLAVRISAQEPDDFYESKPGYHTVNTNWRCIGTLWNDKNGDIVPFNVGGGGRVMFKEHVAPNGDHTHYNGNTRTVDMPLAVSADWEPVLVRIPEGSQEVFCSVYADDTSNRRVVFYGASDASETLVPGSTEDENWLDTDRNKEALFMFTSGSVENIHSIEIPIADRANPAIAVGILEAGGGALAIHRMLVRGYVDPWVPRR